MINYVSTTYNRTNLRSASGSMTYRKSVICFVSSGRFFWVFSPSSGVEQDMTIRDRERGFARTPIILIAPFDEIPDMKWLGHVPDQRCRVRLICLFISIFVHRDFPVGGELGARADQSVRCGFLGRSLCASGTGAEPPPL